MPIMGHIKTYKKEIAALNKKIKKEEKILKDNDIIIHGLSVKIQEGKIIISQLDVQGARVLKN